MESEIKNVIICGIGAIGSIYADKIHNKTPDNLRILVDKSRKERYLKNPTIFNGHELKLNYILPEDNNFKADLIIIATKFNGLNDALDNIFIALVDDDYVTAFEADIFVSVDEVAARPRFANRARKGVLHGRADDIHTHITQREKEIDEDESQ